MMQRRSNAYHISVLAVLMAIASFRILFRFWVHSITRIEYYDNSRDGYPGCRGLGTA